MAGLIANCCRSSLIWGVKAIKVEIEQVNFDGFACGAHAYVAEAAAVGLVSECSPFADERLERLGESELVDRPRYWLLPLPRENPDLAALQF